MVPPQRWASPPGQEAVLVRPGQVVNKITARSRNRWFPWDRTLEGEVWVPGPGEV